MLKAGIVGVGCISGIYLENLTKVFKDVKVVALCDLIRSRAEQAAEKYGIEKIYDTMYELFEDPEIDIVLNLTRRTSTLKYQRRLLTQESTYTPKSRSELSFRRGLSL